jgi:hypothetical protein
MLPWIVWKLHYNNIQEERFNPFGINRLTECNDITNFVSLFYNLITLSIPIK